MIFVQGSLFLLLNLKIVANQGNIAVDIGNSDIKSGKFLGDQLLEKKHWKNLKDLKDHYSTGNFQWIFSSVGNNDPEINTLFEGYSFIILSQATKVPLHLNYRTPETLGMDRLSAAVGAFAISPEKNILIIDAGTCVTYDVVDAKGVFQGGAIAPGFKMRMKAMGHFTRQLPDISEEWEKIPLEAMGKTTKECLLTGTYGGMIHEMNGFMARYRKDYSDLIVMLTGGDARYFESRLKGHIFADSNLVLTGLNRILTYNT